MPDTASVENTMDICRAFLTKRFRLISALSWVEFKGHPGQMHTASPSQQETEPRVKYLLAHAFSLLPPSSLISPFPQLYSLNLSDFKHVTDP